MARVTPLGCLAVALLLMATVGCKGAFGTPALYGPKSCADEAEGSEFLDDEDKPIPLAGYPTANGKVVTCLPMSDVTFLLCGRELALLSQSEKSNSKAALKALDKLDAAAEVSEELKSTFAAEGELARARAAMMRSCVALLASDPKSRLKVLNTVIESTTKDGGGE